MLCAGALALACGPLARSNEAPRQDTTVAVTPDAPADQRALARSVNVSVSEDVTFSLHLTNWLERRAELTFPNGQTHDFYVLDSTGREIWRWSTGRMFTQAMQKRSIGSRETLSFDERWVPAGRTGDFTAVGVLLSSTHPIEDRVPFTLP